MENQLPDQVAVSTNGKPNLILTNDLVARLSLLTLIFLTIVSVVFFLYPPLRKDYVFVLEKKEPTPPTEQQKGPFLCPSVGDFCKNGGDIKVGKSYVGFGAPLEKESAIFAAFDGEISATRAAIAVSPRETKIQNVVVLTLTNKERLLQAAYYYVGSPPEKKTVKEGELLSQISGEVMPLYGNVSLVFTLVRDGVLMGTRLNGEKVQLASSYFK